MQRDGRRAAPPRRASSCRRRPRRGPRAPVRSRTSAWTNTRRRSRRNASASAFGVARLDASRRAPLAPLPNRTARRRVARSDSRSSRPRVERHRRIAAESDGGREVKGVRHRATSGSGGVVGSRAGGDRTRAGDCAGRFRYNAEAPPLCLPRAPSSALPARLPSRWSAFVRAIVVIGFAAFALALLAVRFVVFPQIESYRDALAGVLSRELGQPVEIAALSTGWDGWNPKLVVEGFRVLDRARVNPTPLLLLPKLEMIVSWTSVLARRAPLEGAHHRRAAACDQARSLRRPAHRGTRVRSRRRRPTNCRSPTGFFASAKS